MAWSEINANLEELMERRFHDNLEALIALGRLREIAKRDGCRGKLSSFTVKDRRIVPLSKGQRSQELFPIEGVLKGKSLKEKAAEEICIVETPDKQDLDVPKEAPIVEAVEKKPIEASESPQEMLQGSNKSKNGKRAKEANVAQRKGGPKPRSLKREKKKEKNPKKRSKSSGKFKKH